MNNKFKYISAFLLVALATIVDAKSALAQYAPRVTMTNPISVDKKLKPINDEKIKDFVDNIDATQKLFAKGDNLEFKITVKNIGTSALTNIKVTDYMPDYMTLVFYPGTYDKATDQVRFTIDNLDVNQSKDYIIRAKIDNVPTTKVAGNKIKLTNRSTGRVLGFSDSDTASFYVALTVIPATGANDLLIKTALVITLAGTAFGIRRMARGY